MFGLLRAKAVDSTEHRADDVNPYSRFGYDSARRSPEQTHTRFDPKHIRRAASRKVASREDTDPPEHPAPLVILDDLHSDAPISIEVLHRALPRRFAEAK